MVVYGRVSLRVILHKPMYSTVVSTVQDRAFREMDISECGRPSRLSLPQRSALLSSKLPQPPNAMPCSCLRAKGQRVFLVDSQTRHGFDTTLLSYHLLARCASEHL